MAKKEKIDYDKYITDGEDFLDYFIVQKPKKEKPQTSQKKKKGNDDLSVKPKKRTWNQALKFLSLYSPIEPRSWSRLYLKTLYGNNRSFVDPPREI